MSPTGRFHGEPYQVEFAGWLVLVEPLPALELATWRRAVIREVSALVGRVDRLEQETDEVRVIDGVDVADLLKVARPDVVTDESLEQSTRGEQVRLLQSLLQLNGLGAFVRCGGLVATHYDEMVALKAAARGAIDAIRSLEEVVS